MAIPERIWAELMNDAKALWFESEYDEKRNEYVSPWNGHTHRHIRCMSAVAGAWSSYGSFDTDRDMATKVTRYCETEFKDGAGKSKLGMEWDKQMLMAGYQELRQRWPDEYAAGFDPMIPWLGKLPTP